MDQFGISPLRPTPRSLVEFVRKGAHCGWDSDTFGVEKRKLAFPIQASRRYARVRQPIERDVVEDVLSAQPLRLSIKDACDQRVTARIVVEHPSRKTNG